MAVETDDGDLAMRGWSDLQSEVGPQGGPVLCWLLAQFVDDNSPTLVAGPHGHDVVATVGQSKGRVDVHMRGRPDARVIRRALDAGTSATITRGGLGTLPQGPYDLVVALDGWSRLHSPEDPTPRAEAALDRLLAATSDRGVLIVGLPNSIGVEALVRLPAPESDWSDSSWTEPPSPADPSLGSVSGLLRRLSERGFAARSLALFPTFRRPSALVDESLLSACDPGMVRRLYPAHRTDDGWSEVLQDPRSIAGRVLEHGLGYALAPGWVIVASSDRERIAVPSDLLAASDGAPSPWTVLTTSDAGSPAARVPRTETEPRVERGPLARDFSAAGAGSFADRSLEDDLLDSVTLPDLLTTRRLLRTYATWMRSQADESGCVGGSLVFATLDNVCVATDGPVVQDSSWIWNEPVVVDIAVGRGLRRLASRIVMSGLRHPWPGMTTTDLTYHLAAMSGFTPDATTMAMAIDLEATLAAAIRGGGPAEKHRIAVSLAATGASPPDIVGLREARTALSVAYTDLSTVQAQAAELDVEIRRLRRKLNRARSETSTEAPNPGQQPSTRRSALKRILSAERD